MRLTLKDRLSLVDWKTLTLRVFIPLAAAILAVVILIVTADGGCRKHKTPGEDKTPLHYGTLVCGEKTLGGENAPMMIEKNGSLIAMLRNDGKTVTVGTDYTAEAQKTVYKANGEITMLKVNGIAAAWVEVDADNNAYLYVWQDTPDREAVTCIAQGLESDVIFMDEDSVYFTGVYEFGTWHAVIRYDLTNGKVDAVMKISVSTCEYIHSFDITQDSVSAVAENNDGSLHLWTMDRKTELTANKTLDLEADYVTCVRYVPAAGAYAFECWKQDSDECFVFVLKDGKIEKVASCAMPQSFLLWYNIEVTDTKITWVVNNNAKYVRDAFAVHLYDLETKTDEVFDVGFRVMKLDGRLHYLAFDPYAGENWQNEVRLYAIE